MTDLQERFQRTRTALDAATGTRAVRLLAVSKTQPAESVRAMAALGQRAFGENYVQEALTKQRDLADLDLEWHLIGPLQSNKCKDAAAHFDWVQSIDRDKLIPLLATFRPPDRAPLNLLVQVNIAQEETKHGLDQNEANALLSHWDVARWPLLRVRGLMGMATNSADMAAKTRKH